MRKYLLDEYPLIIIKSLAEEVGLNKSIVLQQLHYWLEKSNNLIDGYKWVYNTYEDWQLQFPFWSISTIRRTITELEKDGLIVTGNYNKAKMDKTKWYRIDYEKFDQLMNSPCVQNEQSKNHEESFSNEVSSMNSPCVQNEQSMRSSWSVEEVNLNKAIPDITTDSITTATEEENLEHKNEDGITNSSHDDVDTLSNRFVQLRGKGLFLNSNDYNSISRVVEEVPIGQALQLLDSCFKDYKPNRPRDTINAFVYCEKYILDKYQALVSREQAKKSAYKGGGKHARNRGGSKQATGESITGGAVGRIGRKNKP
ncbi:replication protein [Anaerobacillus sp. MEB173]|uniref:replication protein n=1 Tax=Anaerobacillus sp. MEB173 TaxID=3383345 RepID=UPI003F90F6F1